MVEGVGGVTLIDGGDGGVVDGAGDGWCVVVQVARMMETDDAPTTAAWPWRRPELEKDG